MMMSRQSSAFFALNAGGIATFLCLASRFWIEPELADVPGANGGNAFGWIVFAAPILILFVLGSLVWTTRHICRIGSVDRLRYGALIVVVLAAWFAAYLFDNAHHGV